MSALMHAGVIPMTGPNAGRVSIYLAWNRNRFSAMAYYTCALPAVSAGRG